MKFRIIDNHYAVSECGFYTVTKDANGIYLAWCRFSAKPSSVTNRAPLPLEGKFNSFAAARGACVRHAGLSTPQPQQSAA